MIFPSTAPWDGLESLRGVEHVVEVEVPRRGPLSRAGWRVWGILSTYLGRRE